MNVSFNVSRFDIHPTKVGQTHVNASIKIPEILCVAPEIAHKKRHKSLMNLVGINLRRQLGRYRDVLAKIEETRKPFETHKATADYVRLITDLLKRGLKAKHFHTFDDFITLSIFYVLKTSNCDSANQFFHLSIISLFPSYSPSCSFVWFGAEKMRIKQKFDCCEIQNLILTRCSLSEKEVEGKKGFSSLFMID